ncbi:hypothetical protein C819_01804 [Lachnospiraceae bacterium 10-1]|nr:hypothetical protein C819_01804 [Lachnospiraceae bacterium 10-1]
MGIMTVYGFSAREIKPAFFICTIIWAERLK